MKKCKRNIFLIFGYLLLMAIIFLPCQNIYYHYMSSMVISSIQLDKSTDFGTMRKPGKKNFTFFPFVITLHAKYQIYEKWFIENCVTIHSANTDKWLASMNMEFIQNSIDRADTLFSGEILLKRIDELSKKKEEESEKRFSSCEVEIEKAGEFKRYFGDKPFYHKINVERLITEIVLIIFMGGFVFIFFCVVLKKNDKSANKTEKG